MNICNKSDMRHNHSLKILFTKQRDKIRKATFCLWFKKPKIMNLTLFFSLSSHSGGVIEISYMDMQFF